MDGLDGGPDSAIPSRDDAPTGDGASFDARTKADSLASTPFAGASVDSFRSNTTSGYYVDAVLGSDTNDGKSASTPWKTLGRVHDVVLKAGDVVHLARGSVWEHQQILLDNKSAGSATAPVIFQAYGTGNAPTISEPRALWDSTIPFTAVFFDTGSHYITVLDLHVRNCPTAVAMPDDSDHIVLAGMELENCDDGIGLSGDYHKVLSNSIHDIGAAGTGGGIGVGINGGSHLELAWNHFQKCWLPTADGVGDGGPFEYYGRKVDSKGVESFYLSDDIQTHHNFIEGSYDFMESWGNVTNLVIAYNVYATSKHEALEFHFDDSEHATWTHECTYTVRIENNTFVPTDQDPGGWGIVGMLYDPKHVPDPSKSAITLRNNIFVSNYKVVSQNVLGTSFVHDHNLFQLVSGGVLGQDWSLGATEVSADPQFVDAPNLDYRLSPASPAIDTGAAASYSVDIAGVPVPIGVAPDLGAYEYK
jgi:hypothetical protein